MIDERKYASILRAIDSFAKSSKDEKKVIALKIKAYRKNNRLTQEGLARELDVSRMQIIRWELAKSKPSKIFMKLLKEQGVL